MRRHLPSLFLAACLLGPIVSFLAPIIVGDETLYLRDLASIHLPLEIERSRLVAAGQTPFIASARAGGQALLGNLNASPLYPTRVLSAWFGPDRGLMAHFWLHLMLAGPLFAWFGGLRGLDRQARWVAAAVWAGSGWAISHFAFANLVPFVALAPAWLGCLRLALVGRPAGLAATAAVTSLLALAGDPIVAALIVLAGVILEGGSRPPQSRPVERPLLALASILAGLLLAAPQWVETWRAMEASSRGSAGFSASSRLLASFDPRQALDLVLPFAFGQPDRVGGGGFWGFAYHQGFPPFFFTLFPGVLTLGLAIVGVRALPRRELLVGATGLFLALGAFNPIVASLAELSIFEAARFPIKAWLLVSILLALAAGRGLSSPLAPRLVGGWSLLLALTWLALAAPSIGRAVIASLAPSNASDAFLDGERFRLGGVAFLTAATGLGSAALLWLLRRRSSHWVALLLTWHVGTQLFLLAPTFPTLPRAVLAEPSPLLAHLPAGSRVVQGDSQKLFGSPASIAAPAEDGHVRWLFIRGARQLYPMSGVRHGLRYELDLTPEGLGSWMTLLAEDAVKSAPDEVRMRLLRTWGVEYLLLSRPLEGETPARPVTTDTAHGAAITLYAIQAPIPEVSVVAESLVANDPRHAVELLAAPDFDPRRSVVLAGGAAPPPAGSAGGQRSEATLAHLLVEPNRLTVTVDTPQPAFLLWQRAWLPHYRATVDGTEVGVEIANLHRIAVAVPAGQHAVEIAVDATPWRRALWIAGVGLVLALAVAARGRLADDSDSGLPAETRPGLADA